MLFTKDQYGFAKKSLLIGLGFLLTACSSIKLYVANSLAKTDSYTLSTDIAYGVEKQQTLDIYSVSNDVAANANVIVFFYGGCWGACTRYSKEDYRFVGESLADENTVVVIPDFRRYPEVLFPTIMSDAALAVEWVKDNIANYGGNASNVFLMGHSSGAHMALMLALNKHYLSPTGYENIQGAIGLAGPYDFLPLTSVYQKKLFGPETNYAASQPINFVEGDEPPLLLIHGQRDKLVKEKNVVNLHQSVELAGGTVTAIGYNELSHTGVLSVLSIPLRDKSTLRDDVKAFVARNAQ